MNAAAEFPKPTFKGMLSEGLLKRARIPPTLIITCLLPLMRRGVLVTFVIVFGLLGLERLTRGKDERD
jgi:hypothetical protein